MSRNLCRVTCYFCDHPVSLDTGVSPYKRQSGVLVADAWCPICEAKYLAWIEDPESRRSPDWPLRHFDLSFRSTFDDEPGPEDMPTYATQKLWLRVGVLKPDAVHHYR